MRFGVTHGQFSAQYQILVLEDLFTYLLGELLKLYMYRVMKYGVTPVSTPPVVVELTRECLVQDGTIGGTTSQSRYVL